MSSEFVLCIKAMHVADGNRAAFATAANICEAQSRSSPFARCCAVCNPRYGSRDPTAAKVQQVLRQQTSAEAGIIADAVAWADAIVLTTPCEYQLIQLAAKECEQCSICLLKNRY